MIPGFIQVHVFGSPSGSTRLKSINILNIAIVEPDQFIPEHAEIVLNIPTGSPYHKTITVAESYKEVMELIEDAGAL